MRVLIADDDAISRRMLESLLPMWHYNVVSASDGEQAWAILNDSDEPPRIAILDWMMPAIDGVELTRRISSERTGPHIHVLVLTGRDSCDDLVEAIESGADDYLVKPFDPNELRARLLSARRLLQLQDNMAMMADELTRKNAKLAEVSDTACRFVDNVAHEFRTPLTVIKEFTSIIADGIAGSINTDQTEYLGMTLDAVDDLAQMVDDLLDGSRIKVGSLRVDRQALSVADIVETIRPVLASKAEKRSVMLVEDIPDDLNVFADREKAGRMLVNLMVNAIKFSPEGSEVTLWARPGDSEDVIIGVTDQGPGMSEAVVQRVFTRFAQAQQDGAQGFGLGLDIVSELVRLNLGYIDLSTVEGKGTTFRVSMPSDDLRSLIHRYLELRERTSNVAQQLALLQVFGSEDPGALDALHNFLVTTLYPSDLVVPKRMGDSILVVGVTHSVDRWMDRLHAEHAARMSAGRITSDVMTNVMCARCWAWPSAAQAAEKSILSALHLGPALV